jgi:hypothetical protein
MRNGIRDLIVRIVGGRRREALREIERTGCVLTAKPPGRVVWYAVLKGDDVVQLLPNSERGGWSLAELGGREKAIVLSRYRGRKLRFPDPSAQRI